jgi:hypothetical protein
MKNLCKQLTALAFLVVIPYPFRPSAYDWRELLGVTTRILRKSWEGLFYFVSLLWVSIPDYLPFYLIVTVALYAGFKGRKPATVISPFHLPSDKNLPFAEHSVANALQDAFVNIRETTEERIGAQSDAPVGRLLDGLEGFKLPEAPPFEVPTRFAVEVKGLSHEALVSIGRKVLCKERVISGDVIVDTNGFRLLARCGPHIWSSSMAPCTIEGLQAACHEIAVKALGTLDPTLLAAHELAERKFKDAYCRLLKMMKDVKKN